MNKFITNSFAYLIVATSLFGKINFDEDVLPLLQDYCIDCHGPEKQKSGFRVDRRVHLLKGGDSGMSAMIPGKPHESYMVEVIKSDDPEISMPPKGGRLFEDEIEILEQWIEEGANWPGQMNEKVKEGTDHWAFLPATRPNVPNGKTNPVDAFLTKKLKEAKISPNKEATPLELIRRASIVLTGLPPEPKQVKVFSC